MSNYYTSYAGDDNGSSEQRDLPYKIAFGKGDHPTERGEAWVTGSQAQEWDQFVTVNFTKRGGQGTYWARYTGANSKSTALAYSDNVKSYDAAWNHHERYGNANNSLS